MDHSREGGDGLPTIVSITGTKKRGRRKAPAVEHQQRVVHPLVVEPVNHRHLLGAVGRVVRGVHAQDNPAPALLALLPEPADVLLQEPVRQGRKLDRLDPLLQPRQRRLGGQRRLGRPRDAAKRPLEPGVEPERVG